MNTDDLSNFREEIVDLKRRLREMETGSPLQHASVSRGRLRFIGGLLRIDSGGRLEIEGTLEVDGTTTVTGAFTVTGPWTLAGDGTISGDVAITGDVTLTGDFTVGAGGKITIGSMVLDPSNNGGSLKFSGGPEVYASGGELDLYSTPGGAYATLNGTAAEVHGPGARWIRVTADNVQIVGLPTRAKSAYPGSFVGALVSDASGNVFRIVPD